MRSQISTWPAAKRGSNPPFWKAAFLIGYLCVALGCSSEAQSLDAAVEGANEQSTVLSTYAELKECPFLLDALVQKEAIARRYSASHPDVINSTRIAKAYAEMCRNGMQPDLMSLEVPPGSTPFEFNGRTYYVTPLDSDPDKRLPRSRER